MTKHQRWYRRMKGKPAPKPSDCKTVHTGLVLGIEGNSAPRFPTVGFSSTKRWSLSVPKAYKRPS